MKETDFQGHLQKGLRSQGVVIHKISDLNVGQRKPYDFHACVRGRYVALECKLYRHELSDEQILSQKVLSPGIMQSHQLAQLEEVAQAGGRGYVALGVYHTSNFRKRIAFLVPWDYLLYKPEPTLSDLLESPACVELLWVPVHGWCLQHHANLATAGN